MYYIFILISQIIVADAAPVRIVRQCLLDLSAPPGYFATPFVVDPKNGHIWVRGTASGKQINLVVDTGATNCSVSERTAKSLKLRSTPNGVVKGISLAGVQRGMAPLPGLTVCGLEMGSFEVEVYDFQPIIKGTRYESAELHGLIGSNLLRAYGAVIDYSKQVLYLKDVIRYDLRCLQGTWQLESHADSGKVNTDPKFLAKYSLTVTGTRWELTCGTQIQAGDITPNATASPKLFGISSFTINKQPVLEGGKTLSPQDYAFVLPYDVSWDRFRFAAPGRNAGSVKPTGLTSTPENKTALFTWVRAR